VLAIYIHTVGKEGRNRRVRQMVSDLDAGDVPMLLVADDEALQHAESMGLTASRHGVSH